MNITKTIVSILFVWLLTQPDLRGQEALLTAKDATINSSKEWYGGVEGGVPFGVSSFSSFGADKTRAGYNIGVFGGYRFNDVLSAELTLKLGKTGLSARDCCSDANSWLGADAITYYAPVAGFLGFDYSELKSSVSLQHYGVRLNVNLLGFFKSTSQSRWKIEISPMLAAVGTKADVKTIAGERSLISDKTRWHLGAGANLQASYDVTSKLNIGLYSGVIYLTGKGLDGIAKSVHDANYLWESGVRVAWALGKCSNKKSHIIVNPTPEKEEVDVAVKEPEQIVVVEEVEPKPTAVEPIAPVEQIVVVPSFPVVYFEFNSHAISDSEQTKLQTIYEILNEHPDVQITLEGWCDTKGSADVNNRISLRRADVVKSWLVKQGISAERISTIGKGIDSNSESNVARRVMIVQE